MENSTGVIVAAIAVAAVLSIGLYIWMAAALGAVFAKMGEPRWKAWVPILNAVTIYQLGGYSGLWVLAQLLPLVNFVAAVFMILALLNINRRFGHGGGFTVLAFLVMPVWASIIGFGRATVIDLDDERDPAPAFVPSLPPVRWGGPPAAVGQLSVSPTATATQELTPAPMPAPMPVATRPPEPVEFSAPFEPVDELEIPLFLETPVPVPVPVQAPTPVAEPLFVQPDPAPAVLPVPPEPTDALVSPVAESLWAPSGITSAPVFRNQSDSDVVDGATVITGRTPLFDEDENDFDATVISARRVQPWVFETHDGQRVSLTHPVVLLGRNPSRGRTHPDAQLVVVVDAGKTVSKTHARLELVDGTWTITDLHSTNGVILLGDSGHEIELDAGASGAVTDEFLLGELPARIYQER
ncbi:DUF5684 domain-containing protein [Leifsonia sp. YAF41]|uniref:DUF5684 domain-containing protein n=1 Tax=Leifsonia sp. YAF41 TaxID=3233086 RepID=UPI003F9C8585